MKYFTVLSTFNDPLPVDGEGLQEVLQDHHAFMQKGFDEGWALFSGPKTAGGGGTLVMKAESLEAVEALFAQDPMRLAGVQEYEITEFKLHDCQPEVRRWFE